MIRRRYGRSLTRAAAGVEEDVNPNAYIVNVADCMLVLMLGFLVALVAYYGVELQQEEVEDQLVGIEMNLDSNGDGIVDDGFDEAGVVYRDAETGKYYLLED